MNHLLIDGYNLLAARAGGLYSPNQDLEELRDQLLQKLAEYRQVRPTRICVVFDAAHGPHLARSQEQRRGIEIIYSPRGELADSTLKRLFQERGSKWVVITSDREVAGFVTRQGGEALDSQSFSERLDFALYADKKGLSEEDEKTPTKPLGTKKKGPNRRLSKNERKRQARLKKL